MAKTSMVARMVALVGDAAIAWRRMQGATQSLGTAPTIPVAASGLKRPGHVVKP